MRFPRTQVGRWQEFWALIEKTDGCWLWGGRTNRCGYGVLLLGGEQYSAHRLSAFWFGLIHSPRHTGSRSHGMIMHACDNKICVNPAHLCVGTNRQNVKDAYDRGLATPARGHLSPNAKLTATQSAEIRNLYAAGDMTQYQLAALYRVCQRTINKIVNNKSYPEAL